MPKIGWLVMIPTMLVAQQAADRDGWAALAENGEGFVVWESNRDGHWRLWRRELDGSNLRRISFDESGRDHIAPAISPDGKWIAYMSQPKGVNYGNLARGQEAPLRVMHADGTGDRLLVADARRVSGANRAVVWVDAHRFHFLDANEQARTVDLRDGRISEPLVNEKGFIPNAAKTYVMDRYHVHPMDAATRTIQQTGKRFGGCEPAFTSDSRWSVRMTGAGGAIARVDPPSSALHDLLVKNDARMPRDRGYLYFPMVSPCRRLLAFAASNNQHDHFTSDYDVFVAPINPDTLELTGNPVRYTFDTRTDRYPDVFLADLPLGLHAGKAPFTVTVSTPRGESANWRSGDGASAGGARFTHTYTREGRFAMDAVVGDRVYRGRVTVFPATPPSVDWVAVVAARELQVVFNEPVDVSGLRASLKSRVAVRVGALSGDRRRISLHVGADLPDQDVLRLSGVKDLAQRPNTMPPEERPVERAQWPVSMEGLLLAFESGGAPLRLLSDNNQLDRADWVSRGRARRDRHGALEVGGGAFLHPQAGAMLSREIQTANAVSIEVVFRSDHLDQRGPARIVTLSRDTGLRNFTFGQERDRLVLRLRTPRTGVNATQAEATLAPVTVGTHQHIVITYQSPNTLTAYVDGREVYRRQDGVQGDFSNWDASMSLLLGDEGSADRNWRGVIEAVSLYRRVLTPGEVARAAAAWKHRLAARKPVPLVNVEAELVARSPMPTLEQIAPYREGLLLAEYRVLRAQGEAAPAPGSRVRVTHWALLDGSPVPEIAALRPGATVRLDLEPFAEQPQLQPIFLSDELEMDLDVPVFHDCSR